MGPLMLRTEALAKTYAAGGWIRRTRAVVAAADVSLELRRGQAFSETDVVNRLNDLVEKNARHPAIKAWKHGDECVVKLRAEARERLGIPKDW